MTYILLCAMKLKTIQIFSLLLVMACTGPRTVRLNSMRPAEITLPGSVKTLLILDRTEHKKGAVNIIEGILTGETPGDDRSAAQELLASLNQQLGNSSRFNIVTASERLAGNSLTRAFPDPLDWAVLEELNNRYQADAIVSLEILDSDFLVTKGKKVVKEGSGDNEVDRVKFYARGVGNLTIGIRLYLPTARTVVDQQLVSDNHTWEAYGSSPLDAIGQLISRNEANRYLSRGVGSKYAYKIAPMPVRIVRQFRGRAKKSPELEQGTRYADVAKWNDAIEVWKSGIDRARNKEAGFLSHNIAIGYEVLGDFDQALDWAETSYVRYGNNEARDYANQVRRRLRAERYAREQLNLGYHADDEEE